MLDDPRRQTHTPPQTLDRTGGAGIVAACALTRRRDFSPPGVSHWSQLRREGVRPQGVALEVTSSFWVFDEFQEIADLRRQEFSHFVRSSEEELPTEVHLIQPASGEVFVELTLQSQGVLREVDGVDVKRERHRRITQFMHSIHRVQPPDHADLDDVLTKGADIADHVEVPSANVRRSEVVLFDGGIYLSQSLRQVAILGI